MLKSKKQYRLLPIPKTYLQLSTDEAVQLMVKDIVRIVSTMNEDRMIETIPTATNVQASGASGYAAISWDDVGDNYRTDLDGARIWRANFANDPSSQFYENSDKFVLVNCVRATKWVDVEVAAGTYIYWVQWINKEGVLSNAAGGCTATVT
jgi:hypothetical protein